MHHSRRDAGDHHAAVRHDTAMSSMRRSFERGWSDFGNQEGMSSERTWRTGRIGCWLAPQGRITNSGGQRTRGSALLTEQQGRDDSSRPLYLRRVGHDMGLREEVQRTNTHEV